MKKKPDGYIVMAYNYPYKITKLKNEAIKEGKKFAKEEETTFDNCIEIFHFFYNEEIG